MNPAEPRAAVVFAHPHPQMGGTMHTKVVYQAAKALARIGCAVLRFNFRGVGTSAGSFDEGHGEKDDVRAALDFMHDRYPEAPLWAAGMSFGSWVGLTVGAEDPRVSTLIGVSMPVSRYDFEAVGRDNEGEVLYSRRAGRNHVAQGRPRVLRARRRSERARGDRCRRSSV